jgi:predicted phosphoribosyltransferase
MKEQIEKQILEWEKELVKQKQTKEQAEAVLAETTKNIIMIEGGLQFGQTQLKNFQESGSITGVVNLGEEKKEKK